MVLTKICGPNKIIFGPTFIKSGPQNLSAYEANFSRVNRSDKNSNLRFFLIFFLDFK